MGKEERRTRRLRTKAIFGGVDLSRWRGSRRGSNGLVLCRGRRRGGIRIVVEEVGGSGLQRLIVVESRT
jgi:hypothetical protein